MDRVIGTGAPFPAFLSVAITRITGISEVLQVITLLFGCLISGMMLVFWGFKAKKERAADRLAELRLEAAEAGARRVAAAAAAVACKVVADATGEARTVAATAAGEARQVVATATGEAREVVAEAAVEAVREKG